MGMPEGQLSELRRREAAEEDDSRCPVLRASWPIVELFANLATQWHWVTSGVAGVGGVHLRARRIGLDYAAIEPTARLAGLRVSPEIFDGLREMEAAALKEFALISAERG